MAVLALFLFLFAITPARAQSPAILLDIKSPATASPPSESLLTLDDAGDLWIKGHLYDYAFQSTITLDPAKKYWTLRDATGKIVWALEVHNPGTGVSTGDLYSIGSFEGWAAEPDQSGALLRYTNASSEVVFTLSVAGEARARRTAPQRDTAAPYPDPPALDPIPASSPDPPVVDHRAEAAGKDLDEIVPAPQAQGRMFFSVGPNWPVGADRDVTGIPWRQRWYPSITTLRDYGVHLGCRYRVCFDQYQWWHQSADANGIFGEADAEVCMDEYGPLILWWPDAYAGYFGSEWSVSYNPPVPPTNDPPATPFTFGATWSDSAPSGWDSNWGNPVDLPTTAYTRLFLYWMEFDEKRKASAVPRKDGDRWMNVRCRIVPQNVPPAWVDHVELKVWDPAYTNPQRYRIINGLSGDPCLSKMWDGKLYVDGNESTTPYYTQASDVFMQATIHWNPLSPSKPWENVDSNTFDEDRYAIIASDGTKPVSSSPTNFAWISAGSATTDPAMPSLTAWLVTNGTATLPENGGWCLLVTYSRPNRNDSDTYPTGPGPAIVPGNQAWGVNFGSDFRGGTCSMACTFGGQSLGHVFHIRGYNASRETTIAYINQNNNGHSYAWAIAQVESEIHHFNPPTEQNPLPGPNELTDLIAQPNRGTSTPYGWGLFQLTRWDLPPHGFYDYPQPDHLWNWKTNTTVAIQILDDCKNTAQLFEDAVSHTFNTPHGMGYLSPPDVLCFNSLQAATIQGFNGWAGTSYRLLDSSGVKAEYVSCCWHINYIELGDWWEFYTWEFVENNKNYVHRVADAVSDN